MRRSSRSERFNIDESQINYGMMQLVRNVLEKYGPIASAVDRAVDEP